jgi:hypothetical protein
MSKHKKRKKKQKHQRKPLYYTWVHVVLAVFMTALVMSVGTVVYKIADKHGYVPLSVKMDYKEQHEIRRKQKLWREAVKNRRKYGIKNR